ncbi:MAG: hypothetical protein ACM3JJ_07770 [Hyphomicrobiales bacterium]
MPRNRTRARCRRGGRHAAALAALLGLLLLASPPTSAAAPAPADSTAASARPAAAADTAAVWVAPPPPVRVVGARAPTIVPVKPAEAPPDSGATPGTTPHAGPSAIDTTAATYRLEALRKRGDVSLVEVLRGRQGVLAGLFPAFGSRAATLALPDAGTRIRPWPANVVSDRATDATLIGSVPLGLGVPELAAGWSGSDADGVEPFDLLRLDEGGAPAPFRSAGALLAAPEGKVAETIAMPGEIEGGNRPRSALYYRRGEQGALDTGARFSSPLLLRGVAASFTRHESDDLTPFLGSLSTRYHLAAGLPRLGPVDAWVDGTFFQKRIEVDIRDGYDLFAQLNGIQAVRQRAEWGSREIALHARARGERVDANGALRLGRATATQVDYLGGRERWSYPEVAFQGDAVVRTGGPWTWIGSLDLASRRVSYRADSVPAFTPRIGSMRATGGIRRAFGGWNGEATVAGDWRERDGAFADARVSVWREGERGRVRLDLESAHERPSYVDLLTPARTTLLYDPDYLDRPVRVTRSGDPSLTARSLRGALASAELAPAKGIRLLASGSLRRLGDDFGWNAIRVDTPDSVVIVDAAGPRGSGWAAFGSLGYDLTAGPLRTRGLAWTRGSGDRSPRGGSPPRHGFDGLADLYVVLFGGDLPLHLDLAAHATGARTGLIRAPAVVTWDAGIRADFGAAGLFFEFDNVFDRDVPSGVYLIESDSGALLSRRTFHFGIVWYLLD